MNWLEAFILGIIQGLTEFLPISSTGHLYLGRHLFQLDEAGLFLDTMLHIGTLLAVFIYYKRIYIFNQKSVFKADATTYCWDDTCGCNRVVI